MYISLRFCTASSAVQPAVRGVKVVVVTVVVVGGTVEVGTPVVVGGLVVVPPPPQPCNTKVTGALIAIPRAALDNMLNHAVY